MAERHDPLIPAEVNTAGDDWFPWYFQRIRKSKWWRRASDVARARNVMLWGEAYQQTPGGSLADDDDDLAEMAGFGFDVETFLAHKKEIMAPWVLCSDGRWYHPTLCEVVLEAWSRRTEKRKKDAARQAAWRAKVRSGGDQDQSADLFEVTPQSENVERDAANVTREIGSQTLQTEQTLEDADASLSPDSDETAPDEKKYPPDFEAAWKAYPHVKGRSSKSKSHGYWRRLSPPRRKALPSAVARFAREGREPKSDFGARAMDRWLKDELYLDWISDDAPPPTSATRIFPGPPNVRAAIVAAKDEAWVKSWLDICGYTTVPQPAITNSMGTVIDRLRREVGHILKEFNVALVQERAA